VVSTQSTQGTDIKFFFFFFFFENEPSKLFLKADDAFKHVT
jgi:hypothetical protein